MTLNQIKFSFQRVMGDAGFFRGTNSDQDSRFANKQSKLKSQLRFDKCLERKVDMNKVNVDFLKPWITKRCSEILGFDDDVVIDFVFNMLDSDKVSSTFTAKSKSLFKSRSFGVCFHRENE